MSDYSRQSFTDKTTSALKPDQQKSGTEQTRDTARGQADSTAQTLQPDSQKSTTQQVGDTVTGSGDKSWTDKAKETVGLDKE